MELARDAVRIDSNGSDPAGALEAYAKVVTSFNNIIEAEARGEGSRSIQTQVDELRRLRSIVSDHFNRLPLMPTQLLQRDTYNDRMRVLSTIYGLPIPKEALVGE